MLLLRGVASLRLHLRHLVSWHLLAAVANDVASNRNGFDRHNLRLPARRREERLGRNFLGVNEDGVSDDWHVAATSAAGVQNGLDDHGVAGLDESA